MNGQFLQDLIDRFPTGYIYYEFIPNAHGSGGGFKILDTNRAVEEMTRLKKNAMIGEKAIDVFAKIKSDEMDWNDFFCDIAMNGIEHEMSCHVNILSSRYKMTSYFPDEGHLVAIFEKIVAPQKEIPSESPSQLLEAMFQEHTAIMMITDPITNKIIDVNPAACDFYGYTKDELLEMYVQDLSPLYLEEIKKRSYLTLRDYVYVLLPYHLKNGDVRMVDIYSSPIIYKNHTYYFSILFDVTKREKYKIDLYREKELLKITFESIGDGVVTTDKDGRITFLNRSAQEITGWYNLEAQNREFTDVFDLRNEGTGKTVENPIDKVLQTGGVVGLANHTVLMNKRGYPVPVADSAAPIKDENGNIFGVVMVFRDVSHDREQQDHIFNLSCHDSLTGLYNRMFLSENIGKLDTDENLPIVVIIGDVNGLKLINDAFGHLEGDRLLIKVADSLRESCREEDIIIRWGGDEFLIILPRTSAQQADDVVRKMQNDFIKNSHGAMQLSVSLGYAVKESLKDDFQNVLKEAEIWMYHKKLLESKSHRNNIISTLLTTLYENNIGEAKQSSRLEIYCHAIGEKLGLSDKEQNELSLFAMLHDIGMIGIHRDILQKPGSLTSLELDEMHQHPEIGYRIAQNTPELSGVSEYILLHHERWDGKGYPRGFKGEEIPLPCRILAVADAYDVMITPNVYKKTYSSDEAVDELVRNVGTQFDPKIVELFIGILKNDELPNI